MENIQQYIDNIPSHRTAFIDESQHYTYADLSELKIKNFHTIEELQGSVVVINGRGRLEFALLLTMIDSYVEKILFLPQDIDKNLHDKYYQEVGVDFEVYLENDMLKYNRIGTPEDKNHKKEIHKTEWIIPTSGTTNIPKLVAHSFQSLTKSTKSNIEIGEAFRWGLVFDIYRFSGIQVFLQSILAGSTLIIANSENNMSETIKFLAKKQCNALSATPSFWRKVLMSKESDKLMLNRITLGGEIADNNILQALKQKYPQAKITHIYASTEVGVGFSVSDGKEGFPREYMTGRLENIKMKIDSNGLLWISPSNKDQKYLSPDKMYDSDGYINTGDLVEERGERVYFLGRNSGAINVGGNKVQPEEVEAKLLSTGLLSAAYVYAIKNPMMGSLVCADVVLNDEDIDEKEAKLILLKHCREQMESFKVPAIIKFVKELQMTQSGKIKRANK